MTSEPMDPDPVARVQQRFAKLETGLEQERRPAAPPAAPPAPAVDTTGIEAAVTALRVRLDQQLDELRHELEGAFDEVCTMVERTAHAVDTQQAQLSAVVAKVEALGAAVEVDLTPLVPPIAALDEKVRAIGRMLDAGRPGSPPAPPPEPDLTPVVQGMARLSRDLAEQRADLGRLAHALRTTTDDGVEVDLAYLEEVVRRGAVANAADIANLRTDVEQLTTTLRDQSTSLVEVRKQVEWIRQRLLGR